MYCYDNESGTPRNTSGMPDLLKTLEKVAKKAWRSVFQKRETPSKKSHET
jgi:hypothetical protein